ncbi:glycosyltransferase family 87 protein [Nocardioides daejeonensis]|uniref:glycosyltransferase family 87 protein n=1 Tax=Nocardioides daejeonensis TaxID=1046556 RepID=UPI000D74A3AA|nr:glycosyltransferase 87 family protein [Nocardioides daejeonensis]
MTDTTGAAASDRPAAPTQEDPLVASLSEAIGGPVGERARPHRWWTPARVILALAALCFVLGMVQKAPCWSEDWSDGQQRYARMCYSDMPYLYVGRGFAELSWPYSDDDQTRARYEVMEYPVGISYFAWAAAWTTQALHGFPDVVARGSRAVGDLSADPDIIAERTDYVAVSAVLLGAATLVATWFLIRTHRRRPWDAALFALSPVLILNGLINWDLLAVATVAGALWAWSRDRPVLTGLMIGVGTATKLYPLFLLGGILVIALRRGVGRAHAGRRRHVWEAFALTTLVAAASWLLVNLPAMVTGWSEWKVFWTFNSERGGDLGSIWLVLNQAGQQITADQINLASWIFFGCWCLAVLLLGIAAPEDPRLAQLGFLIVAGFLLVNKVYSPQYVLWLLPLAVLARPRWRDQLIWQAGEILYFASVWWYLGGYLQPGSGDQPGFYWIAIGLRIACELYLIGIVVRDILRPRHDVVRRYEPACPPGQLPQDRHKADVLG